MDSKQKQAEEDVEKYPVHYLLMAVVVAPLFVVFWLVELLRDKFAK